MCTICGLEYQHSNSPTRHCLAAHQLVRQNVQFVTVSDHKLVQRQGDLRRQQMSSRRRRRQADSSTVPMQSSRMTTVRSWPANEPEPVAEENWDDLFDVPNLPDLSAASVPETVEAGSQTECVESVSVAINTDFSRPVWPSVIDRDF